MAVLFLAFCMAALAPATAVRSLDISQYARNNAERSYAFRNFVERLFHATDSDSDGWVRLNEMEKGSLIDVQLKDYPPILNALTNHAKQSGALDKRDFQNIIYKMSPKRVVDEMESKIPMFNETQNSVMLETSWGGIALRSEICHRPCWMPRSTQSSSTIARVGPPTCKFFIPRFNQEPNVACTWDLTYGCVGFATDCSEDGVDRPGAGWYGPHWDADGPYGKYNPGHKDYDGLSPDNYEWGDDWMAANAPASAPAPAPASAPAPAPAPAPAAEIFSEFF
jgi:hypothetical protein